MSANALLRDLLHPIEPEEFVAQYWDKRSLYLTGARDKHAALGFDVDGFWRSARAAEEHIEAPLMALFSDEDGWARVLRVDVRRARELFRAGFSVIFDNVDRFHPELRALSVEIKLAMGYAGTVACNAYLSPDGGGAPIHFDNQSVFSLQISGKKTWAFGKTPAIASPERGWVHVAGPLAQGTPPWAEGLTPPDETSLSSATLEQGDLIYVPAGAWHRPRASGHSLGVTLTLAPHTARRLLELVQSQLESKVAWRQSLPPALPRPFEVGAPAPLHDFLRHRLEELQSAINALTLDDVIEQWAIDVHGVDVPAIEAEAHALRPTSMLQASTAATRCISLRSEGGEKKLLVLCRGEAIEMDESAGPLVVEALRQERFLANDAMGWLPSERRNWAHTRQALEALIGVGALIASPVPAQGRP